MAAIVDDISVDYYEDNVQTVKQLDKKILTKGAWTTILFKYQDWDRAKQVFGPVKFSIRRYQKRNNEYHQKSKFVISNQEQARQIIQALQGWLDT